MGQDELSTTSDAKITTCFVVGAVGAICFRSLTILQDVSPVMVRPIWYLAVLAYICFFHFRYKISKKRRKAISDHDLVKKLGENEQLTGADKKALKYIVDSITRSKEVYNYYLVFTSSIIAIVIDLAINSLETS